MPNVFLSYAQQDSAVATRVFEDLTRAHVGDVWCYEVTSEYGADFRKEYAQRIRSAQAFLLFDSVHARTSTYVREEVEICRSTPGIALLVCLCEPLGTWRDGELFEGHNRLVYFEFWKYEEAIRNLCGHFQSSYVPRFTMPRDKDFEQEVRSAVNDFPLEKRQAVLDRYEFFRLMFARDPAVAEAQLLVLIRGHLDPVKAPVISPLLALGALRNEAKRYSAAEEVFTQVTARMPSDPRGWAGQGAALFGLGRYRDAASAWTRSLACIRASDNPAHLQFENEVRHNAARAFLEAGDATAAWHILAPGLTHAERPTEDLVLAGKTLLALADDRAENMLALAAHRVIADTMVQSDVIVDLVEGLRRISAHSLVGQVLVRAIDLYPLEAAIVRQWAVYKSDGGDFEAAIAYYEKALRLDPNNLRCLAELAMLTKAVGGRHGWRELVRNCLNASSLSPTDEYYLGLAHFLDGRKETARYHHERSQQSATCAHWPYYEELAG
jgi:tetratricopeptide (TPR) repeat protein